MPRIGTAVCLLATLLGSSLTSRASAQIHVGFGIHGGHHWHHHGHYHGGHYGWYDYGWYPRYAYRPYEYVYVAPPPPPQTIIVQPTAPAPQAAPIDQSALPSSTPAQPSVQPNTLPAQGGRRIVIRNVTRSETSVFFVINGTTECELAPGEVKLLKESADVLVEFDRGGKFGTSTQELGSGTYEFDVTDQGWKLQRSLSDASRAGPRVVKKNSLPSAGR